MKEIVDQSEWVSSVPDGSALIPSNSSNIIAFASMGCVKRSYPRYHTELLSNAGRMFLLFGHWRRASSPQSGLAAEPGTRTAQCRPTWE